MRRFNLTVWYGIATMLVGTTVGCRTNNRAELLEAEIRAKDQRIYNLESQLSGTRALNQALEGELFPVCGPDGVPLAAIGRPYPATTGSSSPGNLIGLKTITIGAGSGGVDEDRVPGDEALQINLIPKDEDGSAIKSVGSVIVTAREIDPRGTKSLLGSWQIDAEKLRRSWRSGLLSTGYVLILPWKTLPNQDRLRVEVRFTALDGQVYEAEKDVTIRIPARGTLIPNGEVIPQPPPSLPAPDLKSVVPPISADPKVPAKATLESAVRILPPIIIEPTVP